MSEFVSDHTGMKIEIGSFARVKGIWYEIMSKDDKKYQEKFPYATGDYIPVRDVANGNMNGFFYSAFEKIQGPGAIQTALKVFFIELQYLITEYDMEDTIFGDKIVELIDSYRSDMKGLTRSDSRLELSDKANAPSC